MGFSVNWHSSDGHGTTSRTTIHRADCIYAQNRHGPKWQHFEALEDAEAYAATSPYRRNYCGHCDPRRADPDGRPSPSRRQDEIASTPRRGAPQWSMAGITRRDWWLGIALLLVALLMHAWLRR